MRELQSFVFLLLFAYSPYAISSKCFALTEVYFDARASGLSLVQKAKIDDAIGIIRNRGRRVDVVVVIGHTDNSEVKGTNRKKLSIARAESVRQYLLRTNPDLKEHVEVDGKGSLQPIHHLDHLNRRVEMEIACY
ncbi:MAG: OmpA family protein [Burkholderiales bacterium]